MPAAQVLPYVPSFGEKLTEAIGEGVGNITEGYRTRLENQSAQNAMGVIQDPKKSPMQKITAIMGLPERFKNHISPALAAVLGPQAQAEANVNEFNNIKSKIPGQGQPSNAIEGTNGAVNSNPQAMPNANQMMQEANPNGMPAQQQVDPNNIETWPDQAISQMMLSPGQIGVLGKSEFERRQKIQAEQRKEQAAIRTEERSGKNKAADLFFEKVESDRNTLPNEEMAGAMILDAVKSGEIDPWSSAHWGDIARSFGVPDAVARILDTPESKEFKTGLKQFIGSTVKDSFRGTTNQREIALVEDMLAQVGVSREGNLAAAWGVQVATDIKKERIRLADQLAEQGVSRAKIPATVDKMMAPYRKQLHDEYFEALNSLKKK